MHSLIGGDVKFLMECRFTKSRNYDYSLKQHFNIINSRLLSIRPPQFIPCPPKSLNTLSSWKCKDFLTFIIYYALIVFKGLMSDIYFEHLTKLIISLEILLTKKIVKESLDYAQVLLEDFVNDMTPLYGVLSMKSGMHELLHIVDCTKELGHPNSLNLFQFEEINRKVLTLINGRDLLGIEFLNNFNLLQTLNCFLNRFEFENIRLKDFVKKNFQIKSTNNKESTPFNQIRVTSKINFVNLEKYGDTLSTILNISLDKVPTISRCYYNNILFTDSNKETNHCDYFIQDKELKKFGSIKFIIYTENKVFTLAKEYVVFEENYFSKKIEIKSSGLLATKTKNFFFSKIGNLEKKFVYQINESLFYINNFKINHLFT